MSGADESRAPNTERGEMSLLLAGTAMGLRPSYEAIVAIEAGTARGLVDLARDAIAAKLSLGVTAQIVTECVRAWGRETENKDAAGSQAGRIGRLILDSPGGFHEVQRAISGLLSMAVTGGYDSSGNVRPAAETMTTSTTSGEVPAAG